jgi:NADH dehydrogenase
MALMNRRLEPQIETVFLMAGEEYSYVSSTLMKQVFELGGPQVLTFKECMQELLMVVDRRRLLVPVPFWVANIQASILQLLPNPLLTVDQVKLLKKDNVVSATAPGLAELGIIPTSAEAVIPSYLWRYRAKGEYADQARREIPTP